jgi:hypothetical protein
VSNASHYVLVRCSVFDLVTQEVGPHTYALEAVLMRHCRSRNVTETTVSDSRKEGGTIGTQALGRADWYISFPAMTNGDGGGIHVQQGTARSSVR